MTDELKDLGRRAIACRGWKWLDGMLDGNIHEQRYSADNQGFLELNDFDWSHKGAYPNSLPDFSDPATVGCLLALVRESMKDPSIYARLFLREGRWCTCSDAYMGTSLLVNGKYLWGDTEAEALVVALEVANAL
jgi:hypothetical protein